jgi:hypothetical protein
MATPVSTVTVRAARFQSIRAANRGRANPAIIKPADRKRRTIGKHKGLRRFIDPEAQVLFDARRSTSSWRRLA